ncbi:hypothetical protein JCM8097_003777 [Rhodosporidiobolus ruineniae]
MSVAADGAPHSPSTSSSEERVLAPLPSDSIYRPTTTFTSREVLEVGLSQFFHKHGCRLGVIKSAVQYEGGLPGHLGWDGRLVIGCSWAKDKEIACPLRLEIFFRNFGKKGKEDWTIHAMSFTHNHTPETPLPPWRKPQIKQKAPRLIKNGTGGDEVEEETSSEEEDSSSGVEEEGEADEVVAQARTKQESQPGRSEKRATSNGTSTPPPKRQRLPSISTSTRLAPQPNYSVSLPFPPNLRSFASLDAVKKAKDSFAEANGMKLWDGGSSLKTGAWVCRVGRRKSERDENRRCPWTVKVKEDKEGKWRVDEIGSEWHHNHPLDIPPEDGDTQDVQVARTAPAKVPQQTKTTRSSAFASKTRPQPVKPQQQQQQQSEPSYPTLFGAPSVGDGDAAVSAVDGHGGESSGSGGPKKMPSENGEEEDIKPLIQPSKKRKTQHAIRFDLDLTKLPDDEEEAVKPLKVPSTSTPSPAAQAIPAPSTSGQPAAASSVPNCAAPPAPVDPLSSYLHALDPSLRLARFVSLLPAGFDRTRLEVMRVSDVDRLIPRMLEKARKEGGYSEADEYDLEVMGDRLREKLGR